MICCLNCSNGGRGQTGVDRTTCSTDMTEYVQYMVKEHNQDYKARDEKNYYQDTLKQIKWKVELYKQ
ncbi:hypothetical protein cypCar_00020532 [Cyprinus carpio]|nr:hypothetical protein cypCar_00020532 [Cyprinus carpio]